MTPAVGADVVIHALSRLGSSVGLSRVDIRGLAAHESALRLRIQPDGSPSNRSSTERSFPSASVVQELMRLLPPRPNFHDCDSPAIQVPWEALGAFALMPDGVAASYVRTMLGWATVPECLISIQRSVIAEFLVTTASSAGVTARWWVSGDVGWVGLGLSSGQVVLAPSSRDDMMRSLLFDVTGAIAARSA